jgi:hypothetical protein
MSSPLSGSSGAYCSEPLILLSATRTDGQVKESLKNKKMIFCGRTTKEQQKDNKKRAPASQQELVS